MCGGVVVPDTQLLDDSIEFDFCWGVNELDIGCAAGWRARPVAGSRLAARAAARWRRKSPVPRPPGLERDVQFWIRVYTEVTTNGGFLHDDRNLAVVYEKFQFASRTSPA